MNEEHTNGADVDGAGAAAMETPVSVERTANAKGAEPAIPSAEPIDDPTRIEAENRAEMAEARVRELEEQLQQRRNG